MADPTARPATARDLAAIAEVARASGLGPTDSGADPVYVGHLLAHGRVAVAEVDGAVTGFGTSLPIGGTMMLCDLFVRPDAQSRGSGAALLAEVLPRGVPRMTFASRDPRAMALYTRAGMAGRWVLFYLRATGSPGPAPAGTRAVPATPAEVAALELAWTGVDRRADHEYWAARPGGAPIVVRHADVPVAAGVFADGEDGTALAHLAVAPGADQVTAVVGALAAGPAGALVHLPGTHPAVPVLLGDGYHIVEHDLFMCGDAGMPGGERGAYSPGMC